MRFASLAAAALLLSAAAFAQEIDKGKILGSPAAPVRIEVYSDFACPACRSFHEQMLPLIVRDYVMQGKVAIVNREFPLNIPAHKYSREAANYATAAARLGIYQPVSDQLFRNQESWSASGKVWETVAGVLNAEQQKKIQALVHESSITAEVQHDLDAGNGLRVNSTPSIFLVRGSQRLPIPFPVNYSFLRSLLDGYTK